jgi:hypothetical protein
MELSVFVRRWGPRHPPIRFGRDGRASIPDYACAPADPQVRDDLAAVDPAAWSGATAFPEVARPNPTNAAGFRLDPDDLPNARAASGDRIETFAWNPTTGELLLVHPPQVHATARGEAPFDDYVRAILLHGHRTVLFRPFWPTWIRRSSYDPFDARAAEVSLDAQRAARSLVAARGGADWEFELNTTNRILTERTGRRDW